MRHVVYSQPLEMVRAITQAFKRRHLIIEAGVRSQGRLYEIYGRLIGYETGFSPSLFIT